MIIFLIISRASGQLETVAVESIDVATVCTVKREMQNYWRANIYKKSFHSFRHASLKILMNCTKAFETLNEIELKSLRERMRLESRFNNEAIKVMAINRSANKRERK